MNQIFQFRRFVDLIKYRIVLHRKIWLIQIVAFSGIAFIITGLLFSNAGDAGMIKKEVIFNAYYNTFYCVLLILTGAYLTSRSFTEYKSTSSGFTYMMLPASTFEKFLIPTFFAGIGYFVVYTLFFTLLAWATNWFWGLIYHFPFFQFNPFDHRNFPGTTMFFFIYMIIQPLFLIGSIALRKNHFIITGIILFVGLLFFLFYGMLLNRIVQGKFGDIGIDFDPDSFKNWWPYLIALVLHGILQIASFFKLKELEV